MPVTLKLITINGTNYGIDLVLTKEKNPSTKCTCHFINNINSHIYVDVDENEQPITISLMYSPASLTTLPEPEFHINYIDEMAKKLHAWFINQMLLTKNNTAKMHLLNEIEFNEADTILRNLERGMVEIYDPHPGLMGCPIALPDKIKKKINELAATKTIHIMQAMNSIVETLKLPEFIDLEFELTANHEYSMISLTSDTGYLLNSWRLLRYKPLLLNISKQDIVLEVRKGKSVITQEMMKNMNCPLPYEADK